MLLTDDVASYVPAPYELFSRVTGATIAAGGYMFAPDITGNGVGVGVPLGDDPIVNDGVGLNDGITSSYKNNSLTNTLVDAAFVTIKR